MSSPTHKSTKGGEPAGTLFVAATPLGNREDITLRALRILREADWIAAEDTRHTRRFLKHHHISGRLIAYHEHNEARRTPGLVEKLKNGARIVLVSKAGTPLVSDPGFFLIRAALEAGVPVVPVPGPCAAVCALSVSGLPTDAFVFTGFLPKKRGERLNRMKALSRLRQTVIFYESPNRILALLRDLEAVMGNRDAAVCREMTKRHEEILRGALSQVRKELEKRPAIKGECTVLVAGKTDASPVSKATLRARLKEALKAEGASLSEVAKRVAHEYRLSRRTVYQEALQVKDDP